ncbi:hypothetical protein GOP47_0030223 [Adiantum capillus-veneris]|nr:hypothetical protein GOP47_0030223 [Adiantum capillus-veneris]
MGKDDVANFDGHAISSPPAPGSTSLSPIEISFTCKSWIVNRRYRLELAVVYVEVLYCSDKEKRRIVIGLTILSSDGKGRMQPNFSEPDRERRGERLSRD